MARKTPGARSELIHCESCGEDYSSTYKRCPFCGEKPDKTGLTQTLPNLNEAEDDYVFDGGYVFDEPDADDETERRPRGGKRLANATRREDGGFPGNLSPIRIASFVFTLVVIAAALLIVLKVVIPMVQRGSVQVPGDESSNTSQSVEPSASADPDSEVTDSADSDDSANLDDSAEPSDTIPSDQTATSFTLDQSEFTISDRYPDPIQIHVTFLPSGSTGYITWTSSDPSVVTVSDSGLVTAVGKGSATITATMAGGITQTCYVISSISSTSSSSSSSSSSSASSSGGLTLSREDFTLNSTWPTYTFEVTGASGTITWSTSDASVATVDANGTVTRVGSGSCTITATDSAGNSAKCIVRCS